MAAGYRTFARAIVAISALLLTACLPAPAEPELSVSTPAPAAPLLSIHNPLALPAADTPLSSGEPFQGWAEVEVERHGLKIFYPHGWLFASSHEELLSLRPQLGAAAAADAFLEERKSYVDSLTPPGREKLFAGAGFPFDPDAPPLQTNGFHLLAVPSRGRTLAAYARELAGQLQASRLAWPLRIEIGPGLRPWSGQAALIQYRIDGSRAFGDRVVTIPDAFVSGRQVVLPSPDGKTFLTVTFDLWGDDSESLESLLFEVVRRLQWVDDPANQPRAAPLVTLNRNMNVRARPGTRHPAIGGAADGEAYAAISRNAAGDWWQIEFDGRLAWLHRDFVTPSAAAEDAPWSDSSGWLTYYDEARKMSLSLPQSWRYFDPARPTRADLALLAAAQKYDGEQFDVAGLGRVVAAMSNRRDDGVIGLGLPAGPADSAASNFMLLFSFAANGQSLEGYAQAAAAHAYAAEPARIELLQILRPSGERAVSIRYSEDETNSQVWQVWLLSPDGETLLALAFSVHSDEFVALQPLLRQIVRRVRWINV